MYWLGFVIRKQLTSPEFTQGMVPSTQYWGWSRAGVPPSFVVSSLPMRDTRQPEGMGPSSDSTNRSGNRRAISAFMPYGVSPAVLATVGSKSTKQDLKTARPK